MNLLHQHRHNVKPHHFAVGNMVRLSRMLPLHNAAPGNYEVRAHLPERDGKCQYLLKSDRELYQRIAKEDELEPA